MVSGLVAICLAPRVEWQPNKYEKDKKFTEKHIQSGVEDSMSVAFLLQIESLASDI